MIHSEEKSGGSALPIFAVLLAMAGIVAALIAVGDRPDSQGGRVWVFQKPAAAASAYEGPGIGRYDKYRF
ncbi:hypothetical protein OIU34_37150 [Pararhizobium sp. BT-229]|uniref:hypothetical protein n=1 Tax=Pararhizobium sp. BT-229 TaxID=2986923 RepID=UPI0021F722CE|nr:hypothetical protein [Pararhizobium sp. BT-229]MCV9967461.1 hypothetical protein [Pararhizobium sp. BT-229]